MSEQDASEGTTDADPEDPGVDEGSTAPDADSQSGVSSAEDGQAPAESDQKPTATDSQSLEDQAAEVGEELIERVESADPEMIAREIAALRVEIDGLEGKVEDSAATIEDLESTVDELESKLARSRADFQNYKKRTEARREEARRRAAADLLERLLEVHDNLQRALDQDEDVDIRGGVESTLQQFDDVLDAEDVTAVDPEPGEEVDPHRHEVLVQVASEQPAGTIDEVHRVGYEMDDVVIREARVTVSDGSSENDE